MSSTPSTTADFAITDDMIDAVMGDFETSFSTNVDSSIAARLELFGGKSPVTSPLSASPQTASPKLPRRTMWSKSALSPAADSPEDKNEFQAGGTQRLGWSTRVETKLKKACSTGNIAVVKQLLARDTTLNLNATRSGGSGKTPLFCACENGHSEVLKMLLEANADPLIASKTGETPLDAAIKKGDARTTELIMAAAAAAQNPETARAASSSNGGGVGGGGVGGGGSDTNASGDNAVPVEPEDAYIMPSPTALIAPLEPDLYVEPNSALAAAAEANDLYVEPNSALTSAGGGNVGVEPEDAYLMPDPAALLVLAGGSSTAPLEPEMYLEPNAVLAAGASAAATTSAYEAPVPAPPERTTRPTAHGPPLPSSPRLGLPTTPASPNVPPRSLPASGANWEVLRGAVLNPGPALPARSPRLQRRPLPASPAGSPTPHGGQRRATALEPPSPRDDRSPTVPVRNRKHTQFTFDRPSTPTSPITTVDVAEEDGSGDDYCDLIGEDGNVLKGDETFDPGPLLREKKKKEKEAKAATLRSKPPAYVPAPKQ